MSNKYEVTGIIKRIGETMSIGNNGFTKRELILDNDIDDPSKYPNPRKFVFKKDNCAKLDDFRVGQRVKLTFVIDGREWDGGRGTQYFVDLTALKIEQVGAAEAPAPVEAESVNYGEVQDDMPF